METLRKHVRQVIAAFLVMVMMVSLVTGYQQEKTVKAAGSFPASGVHTGTLSHGSYHRLSGLYSSTNAKVCEADTMSSEGDSRASFCMSPGVGETTKAGAWAGMILGFLTVAVTTIVLTSMNNASCDTVYEAFKLAAKKAPEMGVAAMAVSLAAVPVVSMFTKKYDDKFLDGVFAKTADED